MIVTETQARLLRCCGPEHVGRPVRQGDTAEDGPDGIYRYCIAHRCMAWRWEPVPDPPDPPTKPPAQPLGGCGLCNRLPEVAPVAPVVEASEDDCLLELAVLAAGLLAGPET